MANVLLAGTVNTGAGVAVVGATVEVFDRDTTTTVRATFTGGTDANGDWNFSYAPGANARRVDVRITNGTSITFLKFDDQIQVSSVETSTLRVINPGSTFEYDIVPAAITAARQISLPLLTGTGTMVVLEDVVSGGQTFASALTLSAVLTVNANIAFPATQVASAGANTLDDYEEATWTPALQDDTRSDAEGQTYTTRYGDYTKIGRMVSVRCSLEVNSLGTLTTTEQAVVAGLPFTSLNVGNAISPVICGEGLSLAITAGQSVGGRINANATIMLLTLWDDAAGTTLMTIAEVSAGGFLFLGAQYPV